MTDEELSIRQKLKDNFVHYASKCLQIRTKTGAVEPFILNKSQLYAHSKIQEQIARTGKARAIILKARQQGMSTYIGGRFYHKTTHNIGIQTFILTHLANATDNLFKMAQRFYKGTPDPVRPIVSTNNSKELIFGNIDSGYKIGTAENKTIGRSSTIQLFHGSEVAFWANANEHAKGIFESVPNAPGTEIILESTANGIGNFFHQVWQDAEAGISDYIAIFIPWYWQDEYQAPIQDDFHPTAKEMELREHYNLTYEQLQWRRLKIINMSRNGQNGEKSFAQEYPSNSTEAFQLTGEDTYISGDLVMSARKCTCDPYGPLLLGVDPARFGDDRSSLIFRQGRKTFGLQSYVKKSTMEIVGIIVTLYEQHKPLKVIIDIGGLGAGIVDRCNELLPEGVVVGVNAGSSPLDATKYSNKRAEMWGLTLQALLDEPFELPDSDSLHADLTAPKYSFDSNSRLMIERKEDMKKRGLRSSDEADALCLTFALPMTALVPKNAQSNVVKSLMSDLNSKSNALRKSRM